jgi:hypothetical protein
MDSIQYLLQLVTGLGILNVWILRYNKDTPYRGGTAADMKAEFASYGLPSWSVYLIGGLKITAALALILGIYFESLIIPFASLLGLLMVGALLMHLKVKDPFKKTIPALVMLVLCIRVIALAA